MNTRYQYLRKVIQQLQGRLTRTEIIGSQLIEVTEAMANCFAISIGVHGIEQGVAEYEKCAAMIRLEAERMEAQERLKLQPRVMP